MSQEDVFRVFVECIKHGKDIMAKGDEWRLPGLGKLYCVQLPKRTMNGEGRLVRDMDAAPRQQVKCKFSAFKSATSAIGDEEDED